MDQFRKIQLKKVSICLFKIQDYPSISQVAVKAKEKNVNIIFAVTNDQKNIYDQLKPIIAGSETGVLASDSQNVVKLVRDNYLVRGNKLEFLSELKSFFFFCVGEVWYANIISTPYPKTQSLKIENFILHQNNTYHYWNLNVPRFIIIFLK